MDNLYRKVGKRYQKVPYGDWRGFPCDGIFLVQTKPNVRGYSCILKVGELPDLYPFAQMAVSADDLANFITKWKEDQKKNEPRYNGKTLIGWTEKSNSDFAKDILKFLATLNENP